MAPVDVNLIRIVYKATEIGLKITRDAGITAALNACGIPDPGFVAWVVGKMLDLFKFDVGRTALAIAIALEYAKRSHSFMKGLKLQNKCSVCHCKGHNKSNHSDELSSFLRAEGFMAKVEEMFEKIEMAEQALDWASS